MRILIETVWGINMNYNFDEIINRRGTNTSKWDKVKDDVLPMWVADMDFKSPPLIIESLVNKAKFGVYGYASIPKAYYEAEMNWWQNRHKIQISQEWIEPTIGVVPSLGAVIQTFCNRGDKVLLQPPVYNNFYTTIINSGCEIASNNLIYDDDGYKIDFEDFEKQARDERVKIFLLCNPHNPVGRVWSVDELSKMAEICLKYNVIILSDDIHRDIVYSPHKYIPMASLSDEIAAKTIICTSPCKTFNIAGIKISNIITSNLTFKKQINQTLRKNGLTEPNLFAIEALICAYSCDDWLDELLIYLQNNINFFTKKLGEELPQIKVIPAQATYLLWLDHSKITLYSDLLSQKMQTISKVRINSGKLYADNGNGFIRVNIGCPLSTLKDGINRLIDGFKLSIP